MRVAAVLTLCLSVIAAACGARTPLWVPDTGNDFPPLCIPGRYPLERPIAEMMLVLDRSGSMALTVDGRRPTPPEPSRWQALQRALGSTLPGFEGTMRFGAYFFPGVTEDVCTAPPALTLLPDAHTVNNIVGLFSSTMPRGGTPTAQALGVVLSQWVSMPARGRPRYVVLATDGGPNCAPGQNAQTCVCTSRNAMNQPNCASENLSTNCADTNRTLAALDALLSRGVPTYVIGIDDPTLIVNDPREADLNDILAQMAVHGGRPDQRAGQPPYYSIRAVGDLASSLARIQGEVSDCVRLTPSRSQSQDDLRVEVAGLEVPFDPTHRDGWDWSDRAEGQLTLFGTACDNAHGATVTARIGCHDAGLFSQGD